MNDLILIALEDEWYKIPKWENVFFTGVGKINAAISTTKLLYQHKPKRVWNYGTAGGIDIEPDLYSVGSIVQHDMNLSALNLERGITPHDQCPNEIFLKSSGFKCGTADEFVDDASHIPKGIDFVDMEAYAIAKAVWHYNKDQNANVEMICYKFISNQVCSGGGQQWLANKTQGRISFVQKYIDYHQNVKATAT